MTLTRLYVFLIKRSYSHVMPRSHLHVKLSRYTPISLEGDSAAILKNRQSVVYRGLIVLDLFNLLRRTLIFSEAATIATIFLVATNFEHAQNFRSESAEVPKRITIES